MSCSTSPVGWSDAVDEGRCHTVVTGGGTAGHVLPALAVAESLVAAGIPATEICYLGAQRGIEVDLVPPTGHRHLFLDVVGLQRGLGWSQVIANLGFPGRLWRARRQAIRWFRSIRPRVVVSVGGYASLPAVLAARHLKIPIVVVSYDRFPGRSSSVTARWAAASAVAFPDSPLRHAVVTGAPIRRAVLDLDRDRDRDSARRDLGLPDDRFVIVVIGGSQGSAVLNRAILGYLDGHRSDDRLAVYHVVGSRFVADVEHSVETLGLPSEGAGGPWYRAVGFESRMPELYAACDLLIGRAGASTVHEVAASGCPAILVPWAEAAEDHQAANAAWLGDVGAAIVVDESALGGLDEQIDRLRADRSALADLGQAAAGRGEIHRRGALADLITSVALA